MDVLRPGSTGSLTGDKALKANVGETIRLYVGNGGPNLVSSFHVIGEIFDKVYTEGGGKFNTNVQTTLIPSGGSTIVEFKVDVPGNLVIVDHSIFRTFNKGSLGLIKVEGEANKEIYSGKIADNVNLPEGGATQSINNDDEKITVAKTVAEQIQLGKNVFSQNCSACHQQAGTGVPGAFPPLAGSDFLNADVKRAISIVKNGYSGPITVNGQKFNGVMPALGLSNEDIANALTYVYSSWGNSKKVVKPSDVKAVKTK